MSRSASVKSIEALHSFKSAMRKYEAEMRDSLVQVTLEVRRALDWIENDRTQYWRSQFRRASDALNEARVVLSRCEASINPGESRSCYDEKKAFEKAKRRLRDVEEKIKSVRVWIRTSRQEADKLEGQLARMNNYLDSDLPRAVASLDRMHSALAKYASAESAGASMPSIEREAATNDKSDVSQTQPRLDEESHEDL